MNLNNKGIINFKKYNSYIVKKVIKTCLDYIKMFLTVNDKLPEAFFIDTLKEKAEMLKKYLKDVDSHLVIYANTGPNMATFKFFVPKEEDSLKLTTLFQT